MNWWNVSVKTNSHNILLWCGLYEMHSASVAYPKAHSILRLHSTLQQRKKKQCGITMMRHFRSYVLEAIKYTWLKLKEHGNGCWTNLSTNFIITVEERRACAISHPCTIPVSSLTVLQLPFQSSLEVHELGHKCHKIHRTRLELFSGKCPEMLMVCTLKP